MFPILALICFIFATFKFDPFDNIEMLPLGLVFVALSLLFGNWPIGAINFSRSS